MSPDLIPCTTPLNCFSTAVSSKRALLATLSNCIKLEASNEAFASASESLDPMAFTKCAKLSSEASIVVRRFAIVFSFLERTVSV